jgi:hypothetical protein
MPAPARIELLVRRRFVVLPGATARALAGNAWELSLPLSAVQPLVRDATEPEAWDGAIFLLDGRETEPAVGCGTGGSGVTRESVKVTVWVP